MKKTLVALAVAAMAATSANAAVVYNQDGAKVEVGGQLRIQGQRIGNQRIDLFNRGSRVDFVAKQDINDDLSVMAKYRLIFNQVDENDSSHSTFGNPGTGKLFGGLIHKKIGGLYFGKILTNGDAIMLGNYGLSNSGTGNPLTADANKGISFTSVAFSGFRVGADYIFGTANKNEEGHVLKNGYGVAGYYDGDLSEATKFHFRAGLTHDRFENSDYKKAWRAAAEIEQGPFSLAYNYGEIRAKNEGVTQKKETRHFIAAKYKLTDATALVAQLKLDKREEKSNGYMLGVQHWLTKKFGTYVEFARARDVKKVGSEYQNKYYAGIRYIF